MDEHDLEKSSTKSLAELFALAFESAAPIERQLGEYRLLEKLGEGGMGTVYKAIHTELDRLVAIKILRSDMIDSREASARFTREIKLAGQLDHPHIVRALDARRINETQFLVMEYVEGVDLQTLSDSYGPLPPADACELIRQAALGLQCAYELGLVHRDIKPSNLMLSSKGQVKILDLGLARLAEGNAAGATMTLSGRMMGTPDYIAPEQINDPRQADIRADIYSLGCVFFRLITGRAPYSGPEFQNVWQKLSAHVGRPFPALDDCCGEIGINLQSVLQRMVAKDPAQRFSTPAELALAISPFTAGCDSRKLIVHSQKRLLSDESRPSGAETPSAATTSTAGLFPATPAQQTSFPAGARRRWPIAPILLSAIVGAAILAGFVLMNRQTGESSLPEAAAMKDKSVASSPIRAPAELPGWIVLSWTRRGLGKPHLWLMRPDGSGRHKLTEDPRYFEIHPKFSPDGRRIAFVRGTSMTNFNGLWICNADGSDCRRLVGAEGASERLASPVWVSNSRIFYVRDPEYNRAADFEVCRIDVDGAKPERMFRFVQALGKRSGLLTDVSPEGSRLAVITIADPSFSGGGVFTCDLLGGAVRKVWVESEKDYADGCALWSPEGDRIAWHHFLTSASSDGAPEIRHCLGIALLEQDGVWSARLQADQKNSVLPLAWSPSGKELLCARVHFVTKRVAPATFFCMNSQSGEQRELFNLDVGFWISAQYNLGRLADWALVPEDAAPKNSNR